MILLRQIVLFSFILISFIGSGQKSTNPKQSPQNQLILKVGLPHVPGYMFRDKNNTPTGFPIEVTKLILNDEGFRFQWIDGSWSELFEKLKRGEIDILPGTQVTEERKKDIKFANPSLYSMWSELYLMDNSHYNSPSDLKGKKIGLVTSDNNGIGFLNFIKEFNIDFNVVYFASHKESAEALKQNHLFAIVGPKPTHNDDIFGQLKSSGLFFNPTNNSIAFPKNQDQELINKISNRISIYKNNPNSEYYRLFKKYNLSEFPNQSANFPKWTMYSIIVLLITITIVITFVIVLRRKVSNATKKLIDNNQLLKNAMNIGEMASWSYNAKDDLFYCSNEIFRITGYDKNTLLSRDYINQRVHPRDLQQVYKIFPDFNSIPDKIDIQIRLKAQSGRYLFLRVLGIISKSSNDFLMAGIIQNITGQKKHEKEIIKAKEKAIENEKLKSAFLANMSHEIRTPLNSIVGFSEILTEPDIPLHKRELYIGIIKDQNELLLKIINDIIDQAKIESGTLKLNTEEIHVNTLIQDLQKSFNNVHSNQVNFLINSGDFNNQLFILSDKSRIQQIMNNLLSNAFKNTTEGHVELGCIYHEKKRELTLYVEDTGKGIPKENLNTIFNRFHKQNEMKQGAGLGLTISKSLANQMNGDITVTSEPGTGSRFSFTFIPEIVSS